MLGCSHLHLHFERACSSALSPQAMLRYIVICGSKWRQGEGLLDGTHMLRSLRMLFMKIELRPICSGYQSYQMLLDRLQGCMT